LSYLCPDHIHEVANLFPPMSDTDFASLRESIRAIGQSDPIWVWQGKVIDGRHRLRACNELGIEPKICEWDGLGSLIAFVVARNLTRRHLDESQRAMVAARLKPALEQDARQRVLAGKELDPRPSG
jgi:ParB-like chromosome segregation protein Spo0J